MALNRKWPVPTRCGHETGDSVQSQRDGPFSLSSNDVKSSGEDRSGAFWVATREGSIPSAATASLLHVPLREPRDFSFYEARSGVFWYPYASDNGLAILDRDASGAHLAVQVVLHAIQDF
jgi:hypothetical protein